MALAGGGDLELLGVPIRDRMEALPQACNEDLAGIIILQNNKRDYPLRDMHFQHHTFTQLLGNMACALGVISRDRDDNVSPDGAEQADYDAGGFPVRVGNAPFAFALCSSAGALLATFILVIADAALGGAK